ncbi:MAG TPA: DNA replication and repair protein RecF [Acidimicrobiales bacterium]|nr:DNA replication and repair protein RecF [Acidimicrobiales bacterium]
MGLASLDLVDFRSFRAAHFTPDPEGTTVLLAPNGTGKTSLLEAVGYLGTGRSFRGAARDAMIRTSEDDAYVRATVHEATREVLIEAQLSRHDRSRVQVNRQPAKTRRDLADAVAVTTFAPDDVTVVRGAPAARRDVLDDALALLDPTAGTLLEDVARVLRQRGALLRQLHGRLDAAGASTLDVWDERLASLGDDLAARRTTLAAALEPEVGELYRRLADADVEVGVAYVTSWSGPLGAALATARGDDVRRGLSTLGPHRDDVALTLDGREARTQSSQGEQRSLALAIRIAVHQRVTSARARPPLLLLDDVFSELDVGRATRLLGLLPAGQALLTTAVAPPPGLVAADVVDVRGLHRER